MEQYTEKKVTFFRFEDLRVYHKALDYLTWVHRAMNGEVKNYAGNIPDSFINAAKMIPLNIAEGSARNKSQFIYYLKMAKSAIRECLVTTSLLNNLEYIDDYQEEESRTQLMELTKMLGALISSLQRHDGGNNHSEND